MVLRKAERQQRILQMLGEAANTSIAEMSRATNVSEVTIRKDLQYLESVGKIFRTYGKIELTDSGRVRGNNCFIPAEYQSGYEHKRKIGYTCLEVANNLKQHKRLSIITNNISAAIELACIPEFVALTVPGEFTKRNGTYYVTGAATVQYVQSLFVDKIFVTADGVSLERGFSVLDEVTSQIIRALKKQSSKLIVCVESSRFGRNALAEMSALADADTIITDRRPAEEFMTFFAEKGIRLICPEEDP